MTDKLHILFFISDLDGGGAQRTMVNLANYFSEHTNNVITFVVADVRGPGVNWLGDRLNVINLKCQRVRKSIIPLAFQIRRIKPNIVFSTMLDANVIATIATKLSGHHCKLVLRETNSHYYRDDLSSFRKFLAGWSYRQSDLLIALSKGVANELHKTYGIDDNKIVTIGNPVEVSRYKLSAELARRKKSPFPMDLPVIISIGRLTNQKGFDTLLEAFSQVTVPARLVILGEGELRAKLERQAQSLGIHHHVLLPGFVGAPEEWLAHAEIFVLSSRWEGFGHVLVEAMATGLPVIATDCPYGPKDIIEDGTNGLLCPNGDSAILGRLITQLISSSQQKKKLSEGAQTRAHDFSIEKISEIYINHMQK